MTDAQTILKLIEEVDPSDTAKLDEIDAQVWHIAIPEAWPNFWEWDYNAVRQVMSHRLAPKYTRSRDALKAIRPGEWQNVTVSKYNDDCSAYISNGMIKHETPEYMHTEELAELHAIIQAIAYERNQ